MGKKGKNNVDLSPLPDTLQAAIDQATSNRLPDPESGKDVRVCHLWPLLAPILVSQKQKGGEATKTVLREPMMMVFWGPGVGSWCVQISDRVLGVKLTLSVPDLATLIEEVNTRIGDGRYDVRSLEK
jgi:hypothetical protein